MQKLKNIACLLTLLILSSTAWSQDSLQDISIARWKVIRLYEIARTATACDTMQVKQQAEINRQVKIMAAQQEQITELTDQVIWTKASLGECHSQGESQKALTDIQKRKKRRWIFAFFGLTAIFITTEAVQ